VGDRKLVDDARIKLGMARGNMALNQFFGVVKDNFFDNYCQNQLNDFKKKNQYVFLTNLEFHYFFNRYYVKP
jgi:hypothetical protein